MLCAATSQAQENVFTQEALLAVVRSYHPVARQASLDVRIAEAGITSARGRFDPVLEGYRAAKDFGGLTYYDQNQLELRIPTWYGIDLYAGQENITGSRINPEETKGSVSYIGVAVPLLQSLVFDKRRAALQQARVFRNFSEVQRRIVLNDLLREALQTYWDWWEAFEVNRLLQTALTNAETRFAMVRTAYQLGDRPAIDTLEALTQIQSFDIRQNEAYTALQKARLELSTFLWTATDQYELPAGVAPQVWGFEKVVTIDAALASAAVHPELTQYGFKLQAQRIERALKAQSLLPDVKLKYEQIGYRFSQTLKGVPFQSDYRFGLSFAVPLRLSEGRGDYRQAKLKFEQIKLEQAAKQVLVYTKIRQQYIAWQQTSLQVAQQERLVANISTLQRGEETRFANGESSLFLINARELRTIEAQQKRIGLQAKAQAEAVDLQWAAGLFGN